MHPPVETFKRPDFCSDSLEAMSICDIFQFHDPRNVAAHPFGVFASFIMRKSNKSIMAIKYRKSITTSLTLYNSLSQANSSHTATLGSVTPEIMQIAVYYHHMIHIYYDLILLWYTVNSIIGFKDLGHIYYPSDTETICYKEK